MRGEWCGRLLTEKSMTGSRKFSKGIVALLGASLSYSSASAFELAGIWATDNAICNRLFEKRGISFEFTEMSDLYGSGFIIEGTRIRGKMAQCTIQSKTED